VVIVPLVLAILAFAVYPQRALDAGEPAVQAAVEAVTGPPQEAQAR
jgi:NADH-quinone oxidoreductase subunit M